uniref:Uncharacterized protein n=1 Tax=viral metagenome TaxID=1070528 RepID=A0A6C0HB54_9ZZZZ
MSSFEDRRASYISLNKNHKDTISLMLKAYMNEELPNDKLQQLYDEYSINKNNHKDTDFNLISLIRLLYLSRTNHMQHEDIYLKYKDLLKNEKFWLSKNEQYQCYWSENHMICYLSSWHLWNQFNNITDDRCDLLLKTYLTIKTKYYFYEFFSQVYNMYTLSALLNIYDFTSNETIKELAKNCILILLQQFSEVISQNGTMFCSAGRTYNRYKVTSDGNNCNKLMHLLTGLSNENTISTIGTFFATTTFNPMMNYITPYHKNYEKTYIISHGDNEFKKIYNNLSFVDRTLFQWSAGNYFNPENVDDTVKLINDYNLWGHAHFKLEPYKTILSIIPKDVIVSSCNTFKALTDGSKLCDINYHIYNHNFITLTSVENYNRGKMGAQQFPWVANIGGVSVFTQSGKISTLGDLHEVIGNSNLPCIKQVKNVLMAMYNPYDILKNTTSQTNLDMTVYLNWQGFDNEIRAVNKSWYFGEKVNDGFSSYIAVYASNGVKEDASGNIYNSKDMQGWLAITGDENDYKNLTAFKNEVISNTNISFKEMKPKNLLNVIICSDAYYYGKVKFGDISFDMKW